jgi:hypothetical protein
MGYLNNSLLLFKDRANSVTQGHKKTHPLVPPPYLSHNKAIPCPSEAIKNYIMLNKNFKLKTII